MPKINTKKITGWILLALGLIIVLGTHVFILIAGLTQEQVLGHAIVNLVAGGFLVAGLILSMMRR